MYIMTNKRDTVLYTGVTSDLKRRVSEHRQGLIPGFTRKYNLVKLAYYEVCDSAEGAIRGEKQIKAGPRRKKIELVNSMNPGWVDLCDLI